LIHDDSLPNTHEQLLQTLSTMLIAVHALQTEADTLPVAHSMRAGLLTLEQMTRAALELVRTAHDEQVPAELEGVTLAEALSRSAEETAEVYGLSSRISITGIDEQGKPLAHTLSPFSERLLFRVAKEALDQVQHRTAAHKLRLVLHYGVQDVSMSIEDDGLNVDIPAVADEEPLLDTTEPIPPLPSSQTDHSNRENPIFRNLRTRLAQLGGTLTISSLGERGTRVQARVPYAHSAQSGGTDTIGLGSASTTEASADAVTAASNGPIRILVVDSQAVARAGLHYLLERYTDLQIIGEAADGVQAVSETLELGPQVVLLDAHLPNGQSLETLRQIKQLNLDTKVLLLATQEREEYLYESLRAGADGYVLKDIAADELAQAVRVVARGEVLIQPQIAGKLLSRIGQQASAAHSNTLTAREMEVLRLLARGLRNKEIAARLYVSERTVNFHLANIYQKLNVSGRTEALSKAHEQGLLKL